MDEKLILMIQNELNDGLMAFDWITREHRIEITNLSRIH